MPEAAWPTCSASPVVTDLSPPRFLKRHVAAAVAGNALEFYDFTIYAAFAVEIGHTFFPNKDPFVSLIASLATFGAGFALRPLGAVLIGRYADKAGRKPAMLFSLTLMGIAILGLALTPSFKAIGPAAPVLALLWRLMQGFALGGEVGPTTAYLVESAPPAKRALYGSWQTGSQNLAFIAGGLIGMILVQIAGPAGQEAWGWRVAVGLGAAVLPFGVWLRRSLPETLHEPEAPSAIHPERADLISHWRVIALGIALIAASTVQNYVSTFMTTYAKTTLHMAAGVSLAATLVLGLSGLGCALTGGLLADRFGRKSMLIWPRLVFLAAVIPAFMLMVRFHNAWSLLGATATLSGLSSLSSAAFLVGITESLRKEIRGAVMGTVYAVSVAIFGGSTQPIIATLIHATGNPLMPAYYVLAFTVVGLIASLLMKETAHRHIVAKG